MAAIDEARVAVPLKSSFWLSSMSVTALKNLMTASIIFSQSTIKSKVNFLFGKMSKMQI